MPDTVQAETRARREIRGAVEAKGYVLVELTWEPIRNGAEMAGAEGGWTALAAPPGGSENEWTEHALGYRWQEVVDWIERWPALPTSAAPDASARSAEEGRA